MMPDASVTKHHNLKLELDSLTEPSYTLNYFATAARVSCAPTSKPQLTHLRRSPRSLPFST
eukprot:370971-Rhodomonas_salina.1